ncbi:MAG TPA: hypothetical protein VGM43_11545 [Bryobacteraceae bacterium]
MKRTLPLTLAFCLLSTPVLHGTAAAILASRDEIVAPIDSKEVSREFLSDGTRIHGERIACKARPAGPFYVLIAGVTRVTDGFNALQLASGIYREGDTLTEFAARLESEISPRLEAALGALPDPGRSFNGQEVLQIGLLGAEAGKPRAVVVTFEAGRPEGGEIAIKARLSAGSKAVHLLGMHEESDRFLSTHPEATADVSAPRALQLIGLEYASQPDLVGGPATVLRVTADGVQMEEPGACVPGNPIAQLTANLDDAIAAVENVVVSEDISQYSNRRGRLRSAAVHTTVRVLSGVEDYGWNGSLPEPWCGGELSTMLRVTRNAIAAGRADFSTQNNSLVTTFHATEADHYWQLVIGGRTYPLAFDGSAQFSATGKLERIQWEAANLRLPAASGITRIEWNETFGENNIAGRAFLTPDSALYRVTYASKIQRTDWTETHFSGFRRYGSTQSVQFDEAAIAPSLPTRPYSASK